MSSLVREEAAVSPFRIDVPEEELVDLRRRIAETRWPERETVAELNALPQFITEIDGLDIHVKSSHENALPLIITHGWPWPVNERLVSGREDIFFGAEYAASAGTPLPDYALKYYVDRLRPRSPERQLRVLPRDRHRHRAERAAQDPQADPAGPGYRRSGKLG